MAARLDEPPAVRPEQRPLGALIGDLANETTNLVRKEVELAKLEMSEKVDKAAGAAAAIAAGGAVLFAGFLVFLIFAVAGLDTILDRWYPTQWLAPLIVSVAVLAIGYLMLRAGRKRLQTDALVPRRMLRSLRQSARFVQRETPPPATLRARREEVGDD